MQDIHRLLPAAFEGWHYELVYKSIRHIYFRIYPDKKIVRISAPHQISPKTLEYAILAKSAWLTNKITTANHVVQPYKPISAMTDSCSCMVWGKKLPVVRKAFKSRPGICLTTESEITIRVPSGYDAKKEEKLWQRWLRSLLNERIQTLLEKWQPVMGVVAAECRLKKMKTRWGSCNTSVRRIWINAVLVHLDPCLLEYVLVHELAHLEEPGHTQRFYQIIETYLPDWKSREIRLKQIALRQ
ncbi:SprT family zinc-dependent metalloprotease [uncultured Desulfobacter sp.]|uniref:M48 family metallopeptidase n=1 Tax=uncultured Desulfobacter sp. TaxID=240139 RepID=UPI0029F46100|nr:SprT family zinc-dependent metalloprotease [uncultured Desulfobacter sp.]